MSTQTAVISIGRNVLSGQHGQNSTPMSEAEWETFKTQVKETATAFGEAILSTAEGFREWGGVSEQTFVVMLFVYGEDSIADLRKHLRLLANVWGQDAIGLVVAESEKVWFGPKGFKRTAR